MKLTILLTLLLAVAARSQSVDLPTPLPSSGSLPSTFQRSAKPYGPTSYGSIYGATEDRLILGGFRALATEEDRDAIPMAWRKAGMACTIVTDIENYGIPYLWILDPDLVTWEQYPLVVNGDGGVTNVMAYDVQDAGSNHLAAAISGTTLSITNYTSRILIDDYNWPGTYTWTNRPGVIDIEVYAIGGGGQGGQGSSFQPTDGTPVGLAPGTAFGGGGAGSAGTSYIRLSKYDLTNATTYSVIVGGGGAWNADIRNFWGALGTNSSGTNGLAGTNSSFGNWIVGGAGGGGGGGTSTTNVGGTAGVGDLWNGSPGGDAFSSTNSSLFGPGGGGAGGTHTAGTTAPGYVGGLGPTRAVIPIPGGIGGTNGWNKGLGLITFTNNNLIFAAMGGMGSNVISTNYSILTYTNFPQAYAAMLALGSGGGGGASGAYTTNNSAGGWGGWGSSPGGGGGGGGGSFFNYNGTNGVGGAGGAGGIGRVIVINYFGQGVKTTP